MRIEQGVVDSQPPARGEGYARMAMWVSGSLTALCAALSVVGWLFVTNSDSHGPIAIVFIAPLGVAGVCAFGLLVSFGLWCACRSRTWRDDHWSVSGEV